ncbi:hypothetical protein HGP28_02115 [Vibrio sp. SM6]|uniref:Uncharacterized protein n=1 Tax=Vibrio agarilyticus TaxID=2726741 RepID=A0A7X8TNB0_9VIBR|nr:MalM family protein [Vibrio agarilyticus]NLS11684.1 hypothetical protein [Vibrio agarilyticus]
MKKTAFIVLSYAALSFSNVQAATNQSQDNNQISACCTDIANIPYRKITEPSSIDVMIDTSSPMVQFRTGNSYVAGIELPKSKSDITLEVASLIGDEVFIPKVLVLDKYHNAIDLIADETIVFEKAGLFNQNQFSGTYILAKNQDSGPEPRYLVIFTDENQDQKFTQREKPNDLAIRSGNITANKINNTSLKARHSATGEVMLDIDYTPFIEVEQKMEKVNQVVMENRVKATAVLSDQKTANNESVITTKNNIPEINDNNITKSEEPLSKQEVYIKLINHALKNGDIDKALEIVDYSKSRGFNGVEEFFFEEVKKYY